MYSTVTEHESHNRAVLALCASTAARDTTDDQILRISHVSLLQALMPFAFSNRCMPRFLVSR